MNKPNFASLNLPKSVQCVPPGFTFGYFLLLLHKIELIEAHGFKNQGRGYLKFLPKTLGGSRLSEKIASLYSPLPPQSPLPVCIYDLNLQK
jgi:hypothetical protein